MNLRFTNREKELACLENLYAHPGSQMAVVYGRRRLGKTTLLKTFAQNKPTVYYMADKAGIQSQRDAMARTMAVCLEDSLFTNSRFGDWHSLFELFDRLRPQDQKYIFILDEYQYLCEVEKAFSSIIQKRWDEHWFHQNILLILCGSVTSMMHRETLSHTAPLYGRADAQILLQPMPYYHVQEFCTGTSQEELVERYALTGGVPRYLELLAPYPDFQGALREGVLNPLSPMAAEARNLLLEEVDVPNTCWSLLETISSGAHRISEIASRMDMPANKITRYLDVLRDLSIVVRETPVLEKNPAKSKKGIYTVTDPFLKLWFGCIYPYESLFEFGDVDAGMEKIQPLLRQHIASVFEEICRWYVRYHIGAYNCVRVGRQWGKDYETDVAGVDKQDRLCVVGECKWSEQKVGLSVLRELEQTLMDRRLPVSDKLTYVLFSKSGFTEDLLDHTQSHKNIQLVDDVFALKRL